MNCCKSEMMPGREEIKRGCSERHAFVSYHYVCLCFLIAFMPINHSIYQKNDRGENQIKRKLIFQEHWMLFEIKEKKKFINYVCRFIIRLT